MLVGPPLIDPDAGWAPTYRSGCWLGPHLSIRMLVGPPLIDPDAGWAPTYRSGCWLGPHLSIRMLVAPTAFRAGRGFPLRLPISASVSQHPSMPYLPAHRARPAA